jgi:hypothetical protein
MSRSGGVEDVDVHVVAVLEDRAVAGAPGRVVVAPAVVGRRPAVQIRSSKMTC